MQVGFNLLRRRIYASMQAYKLNSNGNIPDNFEKIA